MNQILEVVKEKTALKFMKRAGIYKGVNVTFNPETKTALSYNWWEFVKVIGGKVFFNSYRYSTSTQRHQSKVRRLLEALEITIDFDVEAPQGLQNSLGAIEYMETRIKTLFDEMAKGRNGSSAQNNRLDMIKYFQEGVKALKEALNVEEVNA
jgi:hypothetical protein